MLGGVIRINDICTTSCMGVIGEIWRCPRCNIDVGGSIGEFKKHMKTVHAFGKSETRVASAA
jgi:hypothetical protein